MPYFPPDTDSRSGEERPSGEFDKDEEEIPLMDETVVEGTFEDPFATESEPVQDPWEPFNSSTFTLNYNIDRYALKPVARVYSGIVPPDVQDPWEMRLIIWGLPHDFSIASSRGNSIGPERKCNGSF